MSNYGGITYLLRHGRAPMGSVTRTPASTGIRRLAGGGSAINAPLNYGTVPNYTFSPGTNVAPHYTYDSKGRLVYVPGKYTSGTYGIAQPVQTPPAAATAQQQQQAESPSAGGDYGTPGNGFTSGSPLAGGPTTGTVKGDATLGLFNAGFYDPALNGTFGKTAQEKAEGLLRDTTVDVAKASAAALAAAVNADPFFGGGGYEGPGGKTAPTGAGIAARGGPTVDPAQAQGQPTPAERAAAEVASWKDNDLAQFGLPDTVFNEAARDIAERSDVGVFAGGVDRPGDRGGSAMTPGPGPSAANPIGADPAAAAAAAAAAAEKADRDAAIAEFGDPVGIAGVAAAMAADRAAADRAAADAAANSRGVSVAADRAADRAADAAAADRAAADRAADAAAADRAQGGDRGGPTDAGGYGGGYGGGEGGWGEGGGEGGGLGWAAGGGIASLAHGGNPHGPRLLSGGGDGLSDSIPAVIGHSQPARLADGEFVISADVVSALGGGSTKAGSRKLYEMMDRIRQKAHGSKKQIKPVNPRKVLPA